MAWRGSLAVLFGALLCEVLKTGLERARPNALTPIVTGNSFPSGHFTTALLILGTVLFLMREVRVAGWVNARWALVLLALAGFVGWQRFYLAHHWLSDLVGSVLVVAAWLCFVLPRPQLFIPARRAVAAGASLMVVYGVLYAIPHTRVALPSVRAAVGAPLYDLGFQGPLPPRVLTGRWLPNPYRPTGPASCSLRGDANLTLALDSARAYTLRLGVRPYVPLEAQGCFPLEILLNGRPLQRLLLYRGWRESAIELDPSWIESGPNRLTFRTGETIPTTDSQDRTLEFRYIRLFSG